MWEVFMHAHARTHAHTHSDYFHVLITVINLGIPSDPRQKHVFPPQTMPQIWCHFWMTFTWWQQTKNLIAYCIKFLVCESLSFAGKNYLPPRNKWTYSCVGFCKYLPTELVPGLYVSFNHHAMLSCPLPIYLTLLQLLPWTVSLLQLPDQLNSKTTGSEQAIKWKKWKTCMKSCKNKIIKKAKKKPSYTK